MIFGCFQVIEILVAISVLFLLPLFPSKHFESYRNKVLFVLGNSITPVLLFACGPILEGAVFSIIKGFGDSIGFAIPIVASHFLLECLSFALLPGILSAHLPLFGKTRKQMMCLSSLGAILGATLIDYLQLVFNPALYSSWEQVDYSFTFSIVSNVFGGVLVGIIAGNSIYVVLRYVKALSKRDKYWIVGSTLKTFSFSGLMALSFAVFLTFFVFFHRVPVDVTFQIRCSKDCRYTFSPEPYANAVMHSYPKPVEFTRTKFKTGVFAHGFFQIVNADGILTVGKGPSFEIPKNSTMLIDGASFVTSMTGNLIGVRGRAYVVTLNAEALNKSIWESTDPNIRAASIGVLGLLAATFLGFYFKGKWQRKSPETK